MERLKLEDFYAYQYLSDVCLSPDGQSAVFVVAKADVPENGYRSWLYLYQYADQSVKRLTEGGREKAPCWLDNGKLLYQTTSAESLREKVRKGEVWSDYRLLDVLTGEDAAFMRIPAKVYALWPGEGGKFVLKCAYNGNYPGLHSAEEPERSQALADKETEADYLIADELPFRHDGEGFSNNIRKRLALYDREAGRLEWVSRDLADVEHAVFDGRQVVYTAHRIPKDRRMLYPTGIYRYDIASGATEELVPENIYRIRIVGLVHGEVVFSGSDLKRYGNQENPWFYVLRPSGPAVFARNEESAMNSVGSDCRYGGGASYRVCEDGIYFLSTMGGHAVVKRAAMDGSITTLTSSNGTVDCFDVGSHGIICVAMKDHRLQELYTISGGLETRRTSLNEWVQTERSIVRPERIAFENCGVPLEGWVIKPVDFDPDRTYPGILDIHGGHKCAYGEVYYHEMQLWANEGYFVFFANPRGSDGGGNTFAEIIGRYGEIDYDDLMKFTDVVLARYPQLDEGRLAVTGGSYGGYMTNWIIGHTDRFRCAASQRSIANFVSMFGTSDTGYSFPMYGFTTSIWQDAGRYWSHSPLKYADQVKTPTLFIHSENDYRCPISEGIQMFTALKYHGVEARLCMFKGECHELSRSGKPLHRAKRLREITSWFHAHLVSDKTI